MIHPPPSRGFAVNFPFFIALVMVGTLFPTFFAACVAKCYLEEQDLGAVMVANGMAFAYRRYGMDYAHLEDEARVEKRGFWAGRFEYPWDWRKRN